MKESENILLEILLGEEKLDWERLNKLLEEDYVQTIRGIFKVFTDSFLSRPYKEIDLILFNIEKIVLSQNSKNFRIIKNAVMEANKELSQIKLNNVSFILRCFKFRLFDLNRKLNEKLKQDSKVNLYSIYYNLIFEQRRIDIIIFVFKSNKNILDLTDTKGNDLFFNILDYYCELKDEEEKKYFWEVIMIFLEYMSSEKIRDSKYMNLLEREFCVNEEHVIALREKMMEIVQIDLMGLFKKYHVSSEIHKSVIDELKSFSRSEDGRAFIHGNFVTIDGEDAECLDDAICLKKNSDGTFYFYVAITDIPSVIPYGSLNFYDALKKVETIYLPDKTIDLYHPHISRNLCSLLPNVNKNVIVYRYLLTPNYEIDIDSLEIIKGVIRVNSNLNYNQVNKQMGIDAKTLEMLEGIYLMTLFLRCQNKVKEKYRKVENIINSSAVYHHSMFADTSISANIVQESMLLVNSSVPYYFSKRGLVYIFRNHKVTDDREKEIKIKNAIDAVLNSNGSISSQELDEMVNTIRQMYLTASYSTVNQGHQGLGYEFYSHSTSGARRFIDSYNQYLTYLQIFGKEKGDDLIVSAEEVVERVNKRKIEIRMFESEYGSQLSKIRRK